MNPNAIYEATENLLEEWPEAKGLQFRLLEEDNEDEVTMEALVYPDDEELDNTWYCMAWEMREVPAREKT